MRPKQQYESTVTVTCTDNGKSSTAEILSFNEDQKLTVSLNRSIKMEMYYNPRNKLYVANQTGLEFVSSGPKKIQVATIKRR